MIPISYEDFAILKALDDGRRAVSVSPKGNARAINAASTALWTYAADVIGNAATDRLIGALHDYPQHSLEMCLNAGGHAVIDPLDTDPVPTCYAAMDGDDVIRVFAHPDAAHEFAGNTEAGIGTHIRDVPFEPHVDIPDGVNLDRLAAQLADTISDHQHAEGIGFSIATEAVRPALPVFLTACLARQAELDS